MTSLKEQLDEFDFEDGDEKFAGTAGEVKEEDLHNFNDEEEYDDERGLDDEDDVDWDDIDEQMDDVEEYDDHTPEYDDYSEDSFGEDNDDDDINDALDAMGLSSHEESPEEWFNRLQNEVAEDNGELTESKWVKPGESLESLNEKETKLREALRDVRNAKRKLTK